MKVEKLGYPEGRSSAGCQPGSLSFTVHKVGFSKEIVKGILTEVKFSHMLFYQELIAILQGAQDTNHISSILPSLCIGPWYWPSSVTDMLILILPWFAWQDTENSFAFITTILSFWSKNLHVPRVNILCVKYIEMRSSLSIILPETRGLRTKIVLSAICNDDFSLL